MDKLVLPVVRPVIQASLGTKMGSIAAEGLMKAKIIDLKKVGGSCC